MTAYFVGDVPAEDLVIEPARGGVAIDLELFSSVDVIFRDPAGEPVISAGFLATIEDDTVVVEWPEETVLETPGVYELTIKLYGAGDIVETLSPERIIVEEEGTGWYTLDLARLDWDGAPTPSDNNGAGDYLLYDLLRTAQMQCIAYAPKLEADVRPPFNYRKGQLMHARTLANADDTDPNGQQGFDGFVVVPKSLEKNTKEVLRPRDPAAVTG